ncbi:IS30 family transposase [Oceanivirga salmonicida]|uniref:IS30 family transposase n=1 Tax=Oceanivirga salmonicida TaxID=1769291 RepID=UPI0012E1B7CD|nr:IS30 family transposase [Oceanivirga salmonicida]
MNLLERMKIEILLKDNIKISQIAKELSKTTTTISREIKKYREPIINGKSIFKRTLDEIRNYVECDILLKPPYVCNNCPRYKNNCTKHYLYYSGEYANNVYLKNKSVSNKGNRYSIEILKYIERGLKLGQPLSNVCETTFKKYNICPSKTIIYKWVEKRKIKYINKKKHKRKNISKEKIVYINKSELLKGLEYIDFIEYIKENPNCNVVEMDLLCGKQGENGYILTIYIPKIQFLLGYKIEYKTPQEVIRILDDIERKIGLRMFRKLFGVMITDRGSEFLRFNEICESIKSKTLRRTKIFYCDAGSPTQKPNVENIHRLVRKVFLKGHSLINITNDDVLEVVNNINSLIKVKYNKNTPNEMFIKYYGLSIFKKLSLEEYKSEDVVLLPYNKNKHL